MRRLVCALSALALFIALPATAQAAPPTGVTAIALDARVDLAWASSGSSTYAVYRGTSPTTITTRVSPPGGLFATTYSDTTVTNGTTYYYAVREVISGFEGGESNLAQARPVARPCSGANPIATENCYPGASTWNVRNVREVSAAGIEGYATAQSINRGESVDLKVSTSAAVTFDVEVWRTGYYGGTGARLLSTMTGIPGTAQPACARDSVTGLIDCANWSVSTTLSTTASWPTGMYLLRLVRSDNGADYHVLLAVRDDARRADLVFGSGFTNFQAYNDYGGKSLYDWNSIGSTTVSGATRAVKVSFDRPFEQPRTLQHDWYTVIEAPFVAWMERMGYDVAYQSDTDLERDPARVLNAGAYVSPAHDEYWSAGMRNAVEEARDAGRHVFFSGANEVYWKIRFENSPTTGKPLRTQVCYKSTQSGGPDPSGIHTGTWRDPAGANNPENALAGQMYIGDKDTGSFPLVITAAQSTDRIYRNTAIHNSSSSTSVGDTIVGWEWNARVTNGFEPAGVKTLSSSPVNGSMLQDAGRVYAPGSAVVSMVKYTAPSGALVLSAGTNHWWRGLETNFRGEGEPLFSLQQTTTNILMDMGARPSTPPANIVLDPAPPTGPPTVSQTTPANNATSVAASVKPSATFTHDMDPTTITPSTFTLTRAGGATVSATVAYDSSSRVATLTPSAPLAASTAYTAMLSTAVKNTVGTALAAPVSWTFTIAAPDTTGPTVSISAPAAGATVSGQVTVTANASDNVGVAGVQFRLDGANLGNEDTSTPYSASWDTAEVANGQHTVSAIARDEAGNTTTATPVTVTVNNLPVDPTGLVGAWSFDETSATTLTDSSNQSNHGTISGATRTTSGRFGGALSFDGVNDRVTIPDSNSLDLTGAATLEAWVFPTALGAWDTVLLKEQPNDLIYGLYAAADNGRPSAHAYVNGDRDTRGTAGLALNAWTHLAMTFDGATLRLYVNGVQVSSRSLSGTIRTSTSPLSLGGNAVWTDEWFQGRLDEIRVYNRALSATEVAADRDAPIGAQAPPDSQPPSAPGTLTATGQLGRANLSWGAATDNVGVTEYRVHRAQTAGFTPSAANRIATVTSGTTYADTGMAAGTYHYRVIAADAVGNAGPASNEASATVTADTTGPTVSITAPSPGTVTGVVTVTASASDNVGVASVQFKVDGADLGSLDTSSPYTMSWDTRTIPNGSHTLTAVARDAAGNSTTSPAVTVDVSNAAGSSGLVAAYGFEEPSGVAVNDSSGSANHGTFSGTTRVTTGRFGAALRFSGFNESVTVPDASSLDLTTGMTLEAWVNPSVLSNWRTVLIKEQAGDLVYALYANTDTDRPSGHVHVGSDRDTRGTAKLTLSTWTHLATTYDGTTLRLYVNGTQVGSRAISGAMATSTGALRIGGNSVWGEWFNGLIDEVRVYNRALTAAQIQTDMATPVGP